MALSYEVVSIERNRTRSRASSASALNAPRERELVAAAKQGQTAAFDELWQSQSERILRTTNRITRNREDAQDAMQVALLNAFVHMKDFDGRSSFSTWLTRIAINSALMIVRKRRSVPEITMAELSDRARDHMVMAVPDRAPNPEVYYARHERGEILRSAIRSLTPASRLALELRKLQEYSAKETAKMMGISISAAKSQLFHAKAALRISMKPETFRRGRRDVLVHELHGARVHVEF